MFTLVTRPGTEEKTVQVRGQGSIKCVRHRVLIINKPGADMPAAVKIPGNTELVHPTRLPMQNQGIVRQQTDGRICLMDGVRVKAAPVGVVAIKFYIPLGRRAVGDPGGGG